MTRSGQRDRVKAERRGQGPRDGVRGRGLGAEELVQKPRDMVRDVGQDHGKGRGQCWGPGAEERGQEPRDRVRVEEGGQEPRDGVRAVERCHGLRDRVSGPRDGVRG